MYTQVKKIHNTNEKYKKQEYMRIVSKTKSIYLSKNHSLFIVQYYDPFGTDTKSIWGHIYNHLKGGQQNTSYIHATNME